MALSKLKVNFKGTPFRKLSRSQQLDKIYKYVEEANDDLDRVSQFIIDELNNPCKPLPVASAEVISKYHLHPYSKAAMIIGYMEELKQKK